MTFQRVNQQVERSLSAIHLNKIEEFHDVIIIDPVHGNDFKGTKMLKRFYFYCFSHISQLFSIAHALGNKILYLSGSLPKF